MDIGNVRMNYTFFERVNNLLEFFLINPRFIFPLFLVKFPKLLQNCEQSLLFRVLWRIVLTLISGVSQLSDNFWVRCFLLVFDRLIVDLQLISLLSPRFFGLLALTLRLKLLYLLLHLLHLLHLLYLLYLLLLLLIMLLLLWIKLGRYYLRIRILSIIKLGLLLLRLLLLLLLLLGSFILIVVICKSTLLDRKGGPGVLLLVVVDILSNWIWCRCEQVIIPYKWTAWIGPNVIPHKRTIWI